MDNLLFVRKENSSRLIIAFTGFGHRLMANPFDFFKLTETLGCSRILLRDPSHRLYLKGINKKVNSVHKLKDKLHELILESNAREVIIIGTSAGGFAALLFGHLLKANVVHAFSPFTYLDFKNIFRNLDAAGLKNNWKTLIKLHTSCIKEYAFFDLKKVLSKWNNATNYHIYICEKRKWERIRADHLSEIPHVNIHKFPCKSHNVVRFLYKKRLLKSLLQNSSFAG